jgi:hypothetical protein
MFEIILKPGLSSKPALNLLQTWFARENSAENEPQTWFLLESV